MTQQTNVVSNWFAPLPWNVGPLRVQSMEEIFSYESLTRWKVEQRRLNKLEALVRISWNVKYHYFLRSKNVHYVVQYRQLSSKDPVFYAFFPIFSKYCESFFASSPILNNLCNN